VDRVGGDVSCDTERRFKPEYARFYGTIPQAGTASCLPEAPCFCFGCPVLDLTECEPACARAVEEYRIKSEESLVL
jgi:hypothetical protein